MVPLNGDLLVYGGLAANTVFIGSNIEVGVCLLGRCKATKCFAVVGGVVMLGLPTG